MTWLDLRHHASRHGLFVVHGETSLVEVGRAVAADDSSRVEAWIGRGQLARPTPQEHAAWEADMSCFFDFVIVQPFVLVKPVQH